MPSKTTDRRVIRTREALVSAFVKLLLDTGYEKFTIAEVADLANVGRSTLYAHYSGKEALLAECIDRPSSILASIVGHDVQTKQIAPLIEHFFEQRLRNGVFFTFPVRPIWIRSLAALIEAPLARLARASGARPLLPARLIATLLAESQIALISNGLTSGTAIRAEVMADALIATTRALLTTLLRPRAGASLLIPNETVSYLWVR